MLYVEYYWKPTIEKDLEKLLKELRIDLPLLSTKEQVLQLLNAKYQDDDEPPENIYKIMVALERQKWFPRGLALLVISFVLQMLVVWI